MITLGPALVLAAGANDPGLVEACGPKGERSWLCTSVYQITGDATAADIADALAKPLRILLILVVAFLLVLLSRVIVNRFVRHLSGGVERLAGMRGGVAIIDSTGMTPERSERRARTMGWVVPTWREGWRVCQAMSSASWRMK